MFIPTFRGRKHTEQTKEKMRIWHLGKQPWLGKKHSEETKQKISKSHQGKKLSIEHRKILSLKAIGRNPWNKGKLNKQQSKEKHWNWKGGITSLRNSIRSCFKYRQWRSDIYTKDNYICQICNKRGGDLEADHYPKSFNSLLKEYQIKSIEEALSCEELWSLNNGRTLCIKCHRKTDTYGRMKLNNTN